MTLYDTRGHPNLYTPKPYHYQLLERGGHVGFMTGSLSARAFG